MSEPLPAVSPPSDSPEALTIQLEIAERSFLSAARSLLVERNRFAQLAGFDTHNGARRMAEVLGYPAQLTLQDYRDRFDRGGIAKRIVSCGPKAMGWSKLSVFEVDDPTVRTKFEDQWIDLFDRTSLGSVIKRADILAGIGEYSAIYIGVKEKGTNGNTSLLEQPLSRLNGPDDVVYFRPLAQDQAEILDYVGDASDDNVSDERYGLPKFYNVSLGGKRRSISQGNIFNTSVRKVHWSRIIHVTHEPLDNELFSAPELQAVWNYLCDLDKLVGGGAEVTWKQALQKTLFDLDKDIGPDGVSASTSSGTIDQRKVDAFKASKEKLKADLEEMEHNLRNSVLSRGVTPKTIDSKVPNFESNSRVVMALIAATVEKPQRILFGAEAGELASSQDEDTDDDFTASRQDEFGTPLVRQIVDRLISVNALVKPAQYEVVWGNEEEMNEVEKAALVNTLTSANRNQSQADGTVILTNNEIRDRVYVLEALEAPEPLVSPATATPTATTPFDDHDLLANDGHKLSSTQIDIQSPNRELIVSFGLQILDDQLAEDGREDNPHITVKYGIESDNATLVSALIGNFGPISGTFGKIDVFVTDDYDVVFVSVVSDDLVRLNNLISDSLKVTDTHPEYVPHATIAYVKSGAGSQYLGNAFLDGSEFTVDVVSFSSSDGNVTKISTQQLN